MKKFWLILILIISLSMFLRTYHLSTNPPALYGDELSFAWNAWNILHTGTDEYGTPYPLHFRAFNDYKAPIPVYMLVPVFRLFGMNAFSIRLPVALFAVLTVFVTYLLGKTLIDKKTGLIAAFLLAVSSWHLHLSRGYFESTIAHFFFLSGIYLFVTAKNTRRLAVSILLFAITLYTYFTPRMVLVLFLPFLFWWKIHVLKRNIGRGSVFAIVAFTVLIMPLVYVSVFDHGLSRIEGLTRLRTEQIATQVIAARNSVGNEGVMLTLFHNKPLYWVRAVINDYLTHFSLDFWYLTGDSSLRYFLGNMGMFYLVELPFLIVGMVALAKRHRQALVFLVGWMLIVPFPAAVSGRPFAVRSLSMLPVPFFIAGLGLMEVHKKLKQVPMYWVRNFIVALIVISFGASFGYYLARYHIEYPKYAANWWGGENKAAIDLVLKEQDNYDQVFISNFYTGIDLALAVYTNQDPIAYRYAKNNPVVIADNRHFIQLGKFNIGSFDIDDARLSEGYIPPRSLYIARPEEATSPEAIHATEDGRVLFYIYRTD